MRIAYHASHEQFSPSGLLELVKSAAGTGFTDCVASDHFHPWSREQGQSGFTWSWLGAALEATRISYGVINSPGQRYHPAIIAQAAATLSQMYPGRFWLALGSGEMLNENITGDPWLPKNLREKRLLECVKIIRALWQGEVVTHNGLVRVVAAKLYSLPEKPPALLGAALTAETASWVGGWADGLVTASISAEQLRPICQAFRAGGGAGKPIYVKMDIAYAADAAQARQTAWDQWRTVIIGGLLVADLPSPAHFEQAAKFVRPEEMGQYVAIITDISQLKDRLRALEQEGANLVSIHNVSTDQELFLRDAAGLFK